MLGLSGALALSLSPHAVGGTPTPTPDLAPTTLTNSYSGTLDGQAYTIATSVPVLFTEDAIGHPTIISDRAFAFSVTPAPTTIASDNFTMAGSTVSGASYAANNVQESPFFGAAGESAAGLYGSTPQGFDGMLGVYSDGNGPSAATTHTYSAGLSAGQPVAITVGQKRSFVVGFRKPGVTTPTGWSVFSAWLRITVLDTVPPAGFFAPAVSATDKTVRYTTAMRNKTVLSGRPLAAGKPDLATCIANGYIKQSIIPDFAQSGEQRRIAFTALWNVGYSRDTGQIINDVLTALHAQGTSANDAALNWLLDYAIQLEAMIERGHLHMGGAGQNCGHKEVAVSGAFVFQSVTGTFNRLMSVVGAATQQHHWVRETDTGRGTYSERKANHDIAQRAYDSGHVGRAQFSAELPYYFATPVVNYSPGYDISRLRFDAAFPADYESVASLATFGEVVNICLFKNGPGGIDGSQALLMGGANDTTNPFAASLYYFDQLRTMRADLTADSSFFSTREAAHYDAHRASFAVPRVGMTPADVTPDGPVPSSILSAGNGQFTWNLTGIGGDYPAASAWQIEYALPVAADIFGVQWIAVDSPAISGTQTGLPPGLKLYVRWRRQNTHGWGPWTINFPKIPADGTSSDPDDFAERCTITLTGSTATAPANTVAPAIYRRTDPSYWGPLYTLVTDPSTLAVDTDLIAGRGKSTGNLPALPMVKWQRNSADISGATAAVYRLTSADLGQNIRHGISEDGGATWTYSTAVAIPGPTYPAKTLTAFDGTNDYLQRTGAFSGAPADGKQLTIGMMFAATGSDGVSRTLLALADAAGTASTDRMIELNRNVSNRLQLVTRSAANATVFSVSTSTGTINVAAGEVRVMVSVDLATASYQFYLNDTALSLGTVTGTLGDIGWSAIARSWIMASTNGGSPMPANHRYTFIHPGKIDLSVQGNRDKFLLANIGNQGEGVFGTPALVMLYGPDANIGTNYGTGGNFTVVGDVTDVP